MDDRSKRLKLFKQLKQSTLGKKDLSLKGSIDGPISPLVELINKNDFYYTTSTCSGRITLTEKPLGRSNIKRGNKFLYTSHEPVVLHDLIAVLESNLLGTCDTATTTTTLSDNGKDGELDTEERCLWFKFEPFIMHIQCFDLKKAKSLLDLGLSIGCRNSGITLGKPDKFMVALRSTSSMEIPVQCDSRFKLPQTFVEFLCDESNRRIADNLERLSRLQNAIETFLARENEQDKA